MTTLEILRREPIFFYTDVPIVPFGQGSSIRVFTNLRAYSDLGFDIAIYYFAEDNKKLVEPELPSRAINFQYHKHQQKKPDHLDRLSYYFGAPKNRVLNSVFPNRTDVIELVKKNMEAYPKAIHHFEYDHFASASVALQGINAVWSHHDILSKRLPLIREMRSKYINLSGHSLDRAIRLIRVRQAEDWIAESCKLILNIAKHEHAEFQQHRKYLQAELLPLSWPDEEAPRRERAWMAGGMLHMLHLGSIDGFIGYDSLRFILEQVFPLLPAQYLESLELLVVGKIGESQFSKHILELAHDYPQVKFLGFVNDLKRVYAEMDMQLVGGTRATGLRTRIIESMVYGVPVLSTVEMAKGLHGLVKGKNILLAGDELDFAKNIMRIISGHQQLQNISEEGKRTYNSLYNRKVVSEKLSDCLEKYF